MNILDENVPEDQRSLLQTWGISIRQITVTIKPLPRLKPLPVFEGFVPEGWKDAIEPSVKKPWPLDHSLLLHQHVIAGCRYHNKAVS